MPGNGRVGGTMPDPSPFGHCRRCDAPASASATACPDCGYDVDDHDRPRVLLGFLGTALTLSVVGAPLGVPMLWRAYRHRRLARGTVTDPSPTPLGALVGSVLRQHLELTGPVPHGASFARGGERPDVKR